MKNKVKNITQSFKISARGVLTGIVCVAISIVLWLVVMWIDAPEYTKAVNIAAVTIVGDTIVKEEGLVCASTSLDGGFDISVQGSKTALYDLFVTPGAAYAAVDVSTIANVGVYKLSIDYRLPTGIEIVDAPEYVTVIIEEIK